MQIKIKLTNAEIKAGSVGDVIGVAPSRARRWCERGYAILADDSVKLSDLPKHAEQDAEWVAKQNGKPAPEPTIIVGAQGGKEDKNPTAEKDIEVGEKTEIEVEKGKDGGKVDKKPSKKKEK